MDYFDDLNPYLVKEDDNEEVAENKPTETDKKAEIPTQKEETKNS